MTWLDDLAAFKASLTPVVRKKRKLQRPAPAVDPVVKDKPSIPSDVRRNGPGVWLVMRPTAAAMRGLKTREDPIVRDAPITRAPYNVSHMDGNTARVCTDAELFGRKK